MTNGEVPAAGRGRRAAVVGTFLLGLALGVGAGVAGVTYWPRSDRAATDERPASDPRLVGKWLREDSLLPLEFRRDGTFDYTRETAIDVPVIGARPEELKTRKEVVKQSVSGQYVWVDEGTIRLTEPDFGGVWVTTRIILDGDRLSLLASDGGVRRYTRVR